MKVSKLLKNQNGMSLVSVMMAAAMMGGLALVMTQLGTNSSKIQRKAIESQDMNTFVNNLEKNMLNKDSCANTFASVTGLTSNGLVDDIDAGIVNFNGDPIYQVTTATNPSPLKTWEIERIYAVRIDPLVDPKIKDHNLQLKVKLKKKNIGKSFGAQEITKTIQIDAIYDVTGGVVKCYSQLDSAVDTSVALARKEACLDLDPGAAYDSASGCQFSQSYKEMLVQDGMINKKRNLWIEPTNGTLSTIQTYRYTTEKNRHNYFCNCYSAGISCPSGYTEVSNRCLNGNIVVRCGVKSSKNGFKKCRKAENPAGYYFVD